MNKDQIIAALQDILATDHKFDQPSSGPQEMEHFGRLRLMTEGLKLLIEKI